VDGERGKRSPSAIRREPMRRFFLTLSLLALSTPVYAQQAPLSHAVTGTLTNSGDTLRINTVGMGTLVGVLNSSPDGATYLLEGALDGTNFYYRVPLVLDRSGDNGGTLDLPNQISWNGLLNPNGWNINYQFRANVAGLQVVQIRQISGSVAKSWTLSVAPQASEPYTFAQVGLPYQAPLKTDGNGALFASIQNNVSVVGNDGTLLRVQTAAPGSGLAKLIVAIPPDALLPGFASTPTMNLGTLNGAATAANQTTANTSLASIDTKLTSPLTVTGGLTDTQLRASAVPVSVSGTVTTGALTDAQLRATAVPVSTGGLTDTQLRATAVPVSGTFWQATQPVSGTFWQATQPVSGTFWQATQPVSAATLPLPSGAATSANQVTANTSLASIDTKLTSPLTANLGTTDTANLADIQARLATWDNSGSVNTTQSSTSAIRLTDRLNGYVSVLPASTAATVSSVALAVGLSPNSLLPAFAATPTMNLGTLNGAATAANQTTGNTSLSSLDTKTPSLGQATMANSRPVVVASNQSAIPVSGTFWQATQPVSGTFWQATQPVSGPLTDTQLRATAVPVSGTFWQTTQPVSGTFWQATQPVSLAAAVDVSDRSARLLGTIANTGFNVNNFPATQAVTQSGTWTTGRTWALASATDTIATFQGQTARTSGTLTSTTCPGTGCVSVTTTNYSVATVTLNGTYSLTPVFEFSDDGSNFYSTTCTRSDSAVQETTGGALSNTLRAWDCAVFGTTSFRVRASAFVSGTGNIGITLSSAPIEPAQTVATIGSTAKGTQPATAVPVQNLTDSGRTLVTLTAERVTPILTTDTVITFTKLVGDTATATQTTYAVSAGKTLRITAVHLSMTPTSTTAAVLQLRLRTNSGGACVVGSTKVANWEIGNPLGTVAANQGNAHAEFVMPEGMEFSGATRNICLSANVLGAAAQAVTVTVFGYEY
jgi:hypothetical protein